MPNTATLGLIEEEAYKSLYHQLLDPPSQKTSLKELNDDLVGQLGELKKIQNPDESQRKKIQDMESLQKQYHQLVNHQQQMAEQKFRFLPIFEDDPMESVEVILPDGPDLKTQIDQHAELKRFFRNPVVPTGATVANANTDERLLSLGIPRPLNSVIKVNYEHYSMSFDQSDKILLSLKVPHSSDLAPYKDDMIRNLQKHVLASVIRNPDAPICIKFPPGFAEREKFRILNELMIAYALRTDVLGAQSPKDSIKRRNQFIEQLIKGGTIKLSDTVDANGEARKMDTWDMWSMKEYKAGAIRHYSKSTTELSQDYEEQLKKNFRVEAMREFINSDNIEKMVNAAIQSKKSNAPGSLYQFGNFMMDADGKWVTNEQNRMILKGALAELAEFFADKCISSANTRPIEFNDEVRNSAPFKTLKQFGVQEVELEQFLNSEKLKAYISRNPNGQQTAQAAPAGP